MEFREIRRGRLAASGLWLSLLLAGTAWAVEIKGAKFADQVTLGEQVLARRGAGLLKYKVVFNGYAAALYLPADTPADAALGDVPKRLELHYFWDIPGKRFGEAAEPFLLAHCGAEGRASLAERLTALNALYVDIKAGERYTLSYLPGVGTELAHNGRPLGVIPGADFAACYFAIWLGERSLSASLRADLLGLPRP